MAVQEPGLLWETSYPYPNPSFHNWENVAPKYAMTCTKSTDSIITGPGKTPGDQILSTVSLSSLHTILWALEHPSCTQLLSLVFQQKPCCLWRCSIICLLWPCPFVSFILLLFEHPERKYVFVLLILHLFLYFLQLCQCDSCCYLWGAFFFPVFKITLYNSESHAKFLYWNSKPNQADLILK